jgi:GntR family transcriptional regulator
VARKIDPTSDRPVYKQIADELRGRILSGQLPPGEKLPSEAALVTEYGVAQGTVRQSLGILRGEGLIVAEHGRGVFVRRRPKIRRVAHDRFARSHRDAGKAAYLAEAEKEHTTPDVDVYFVGPERVSVEVAERLRLAPDATVLARKRVYLADGQPIEMATSYVPWDLADGTKIAEKDTGPGGIYARIEEAGHRLGRFAEDVSARMPTPEEIKALRLEGGIPVLTLVRVAYDVDGTPVEVCDTVMSSAHYVLSYELPAD